MSPNEFARRYDDQFLFHDDVWAAYRRGDWTGCAPIVTGMGHVTGLYVDGRGCIWSRPYSLNDHGKDGYTVTTMRYVEGTDVWVWYPECGRPLKCERQCRVAMTYRSYDTLDPRAWLDATSSK